MSPSDPRLTWRSRHDPRSRGFGVAAAVQDIPAIKAWRGGPVLDQGREGACTGFATLGWCAAQPRRLKGVTNAQAQAIYHRARQLDPWPGEDYEGSSVLAAVKAAQEKGLIAQYRWAFTIEEVRQAVLGLGPVIVGIPWYSAMYNPVNGIVRVGGQLVGGHAILVRAYAPDRWVKGEGTRPRFRLRNSWGPGWGNGGDAEIDETDLAALLADEGEACVPMVHTPQVGGQ